MNKAEKLRQAYKDRIYRGKLQKYSKLSKDGVFKSAEISIDIDDYTREKLEKDGFTFSVVYLYGEYIGWLVTW